MSGLQFRGKHELILHDTTAEIDVEGGLNSGKTILCLCKELRAAVKYPGIWILIARWTDDAVRTLLRPPLEQVARIEGISLDWNNGENYYALENGSRIYAFGFKTQSQEPEQRYGKIRGFAGSRIYVDQAEQVPKDIADELRARLRPDIEASHAGRSYPTQLTFSPNPTNDDDWLAQQFPVKNTIDGRKYYAVSLFDNAHNLPKTSLESILRTYPPEHPKYQTVVLGQRGLNVIGDAVFDQLFDRTIHLADLSARDDSTQFLEALEIGQHNPTWVLAQRTYHGALRLLGGIMGKRMMLEDFLPLVAKYRALWAEGASSFHACASNPGAHDPDMSRYSLVRILRDAGVSVIIRDDSNAPDVELATIETIASALRRRTTAREESLQINRDPARWLITFPDGSERQQPFMAFAFEGGFVWDPHVVSVENKRLRQPYNDDEYANAMRCVENLMLHFIAGQRSDAAAEAARKARAVAPSAFSDGYGGPNDWMKSC